MPHTHANGRYSNAVRDVLDRDALRSIHEGGSEAEQLARMQAIVQSKVKVLSPEYRPVFARMVRTMCTTSYNKARKDLHKVATAGPQGPHGADGTDQSGLTIPGAGCGTGAHEGVDSQVPGPRTGATDDERIVAKVLLGEGGELTEKSAQQAVLEDLDRIVGGLLPQLAESDFMEADRLEGKAKQCADRARKHRDRGNRIVSLIKRYERLVAGIDSIPGVFNLTDYLNEVGPQALGLDEDDAELIRYAGAL
ncbi:hypothetical protein [Streptomyces sp. NPDC001665]